MKFNGKAQVARFPKLETEWSELPLVKRYFYFYALLVLIMAVVHSYLGA
jgi:hypothetical protein